MRVAVERQLDAAVHDEVLGVLFGCSLRVSTIVEQLCTSIGTTLTPSGTQYGATPSKAEKGNPSKYAAFASLCKPVQHMTDHS